MVFKCLLQLSIPPLISTFYPKVQLCLSIEKIRWGTLLCFRKLDRKVSHISRFSVDNFLWHSTEKNLLEQFGASENFGYRKNFLQRWDHDFLSTIFCLTEPKNFVREPFCVSEDFWYKKQFLDRRGLGYHVFPSKVFVSQYRKVS